MDLYGIIGLILGGMIMSLGLLMFVGTIWTFIKSYIVETEIKYPRFVVNLAVFFYNVFQPDVEMNAADLDNDDVLVGLMGMLYITLGFLVMLIWPIFIIGGLIYGMMRTLRFAYRIKSAIGKLVSGKKCLKDYEDADKPKIEL